MMQNPNPPYGYSEVEKQNKKACFKRIDKYCFDLEAQLGKGAFGTVYLGSDYESTRKYAIKQVPVAMMSSSPQLSSAIKNEVEIMKLMKHENLVRCFDVMTTPNNYYFILEYCNNGNLTEYLEKKGKRLPESEALYILKQILSGYQDLLKLGIVHRDLKPENIFLNENTFKIGDFGFAKNVGNFSKDLLKSTVGTPLYMAPQILTQNQYSTKSDLWSIALMYYEMLVGDVPWNPMTQYDLIQKIFNEPIKYPSHISAGSKDFLQRALKTEEKDRLNWDEVFDHPIFEDFFNFKSYRKSLTDRADVFKTALIRKIITNNLDLTQLFQKIDTDGNNSLDFHEFSIFLKDVDGQISREQTEHIYNAIDTDGSNSISLLEFRQWLGGVCPEKIDPQKIFSQLIQSVKSTSSKALADVFQKYDLNQSNSLDKFEFCKLVKSMKDDITGDELDVLFEKFDIDGNGVITMEEFVQILGVESLKRSHRTNSIQYMTSPSNYMNFETFEFPADQSPSKIKKFEQYLNVNAQVDAQSRKETEKKNAPIFRESKKTELVVNSIKEYMKKVGLSLDGIFCLACKKSPSFISKAEFYNFLTTIRVVLDESDKLAVFQDFDSDGDGDISFRDFKQKF